MIGRPTVWFVLLSVCRSRHGISIPDAIPKRFSISSEFVEFCFSIFLADVQIGSIKSLWYDLS